MAWQIGRSGYWLNPNANFEIGIMQHRETLNWNVGLLLFTLTAALDLLMPMKDIAIIGE